MTKELGEDTIPVEVHAYESDGPYYTGHLRQPRGPKQHYRFPESFRWVYGTNTMDLVAMAVKPSLYGTGSFVALYWTEHDGGQGYILRRDFDDGTSGQRWNPDGAQSLMDYVDEFVDGFDQILWTKLDSELVRDD